MSAGWVSGSANSRNVGNRTLFWRNSAMARPRTAVSSIAVGGWNTFDAMQLILLPRDIATPPPGGATRAIAPRSRLSEQRRKDGAGARQEQQTEDRRTHSGLAEAGPERGAGDGTGNDGRRQ